MDGRTVLLSPLLIFVVIIGGGLLYALFKDIIRELRGKRPEPPMVTPRMRLADPPKQGVQPSLYHGLNPKLEELPERRKVTDIVGRSKQRSHESREHGKKTTGNSQPESGADQRRNVSVDVE